MIKEVKKEVVSYRKETHYMLEIAGKEIGAYVCEAGGSDDDLQDNESGVLDSFEEVHQSLTEEQAEELDDYIADLRA